MNNAEEKPLMIFQKTAEKVQNKIILPKKVIEKMGKQFYMEIYSNRIVLVPMKKED